MTPIRPVWWQRFDAAASLWAASCLWLIGMFGLLLPEPASASTDAAQELLRTRCIRCHGERVQQSGLRLDSLGAALRGGDSGSPALVVGAPEQSLMMDRVRSGTDSAPQMPPIGAPLTASEVAVLADWIDAGAEFADSGNHWAYVAPVRPRVPAPASLGEDDGSGSAIDAFVRARLDREGVAPSPRAGTETLIRRLYLDLVGLPPTPAEFKRYLSLEQNSADSRAAYSQTVDELLSRPGFGEKWAQHWLDLSRYADSNGFEKDGPREMWRWRDWVIDAFNQDMPFDRFATLQLAGDLLPGTSPQQKVATGFLRNSMANEEGGIDPEEYHVEAVADRVETVGTVFLATTFGCARCHDHKFDPISQREYSQLFAVFNNQERDLKRVNSFASVLAGPKVYFPEGEEAERLDAAKEAWRRVQSTLSDGSAVRREARSALFGAMLRMPRKLDSTLVMRELEETRTTRMHQGGNFRNPGDAVEPGVPAVFPQLPSRQAPNRLAFARWLVADDNPLFARVAVNRIWEQLFGRGLVETSEDFGTQGDRASHPDLLDWLAAEFRWQGFSVKSLVREIVLSETYHQTSRSTPELQEKDPSNVLLARGPRFRMPAEMVRDQALAASGLLASRVGGPSVFPHQPAGIWNMPYSSRTWQTSEGDDRYRRGLYTWWQRSAPFPAFVNFDAPSRERTCARRARTNTPLQALTTLNEVTFFEAARGLASRALAHDGDDRARVQAAFQLCLVRTPTDAESDRLMVLLESLRTRMKADPDAAAAVVSPDFDGDSGGVVELASWTLLGNTLLNLDETLTKE